MSSRSQFGPMPPPNVRKGDKWSEQSARLENNQRKLVNAIANSYPRNGIQTTAGSSAWKGKRQSLPIVRVDDIVVLVRRSSEDPGGEGTALAPPSMKYDAWPLNADTDNPDLRINAEFGPIEVVHGRNQPGKWVAARDDTEGLLRQFLDENGEPTMHLLICFDEGPKTQPCATASAGEPEPGVA